MNKKDVLLFLKILTGLVIFIILFYWGQLRLASETGLYNIIEMVLFFLSSLLCLVNYKLIKGKGSFFENEKNFFLVFGVVLFTLPFIDKFEIHHIIANWFISLFGLSVNRITMQLHALIPVFLGLIVIVAFIKFWKFLKARKMFIAFIIAAVVLGGFNMITDVLEAGVYLEESIEMMMALMVFNAVFYVFIKS